MRTILGFTHLRYFLGLSLLLIGACDSPSATLDGGVLSEVESETGLDAGMAGDTGVFDAGGTQPNPPDETGFGTISGDCGWIDTAILSQASPALMENAIDFADDPYDDGDYEYLTEGGQEIIDDGNAGGSSILSEVFSYEVLSRCEGASLLKTEMEVIYTNPAGKLTDLLVDFDGMKTGVSVTRAVGYPRDDPYTVEDAKNILEQKLQGVLDSTANVSAEDAWTKQILHIIAYADQHAQSLETAFASVDAALKSNTLVVVTVSHGEDDFLY